jgi:hypothetical protein
MCVDNIKMDLEEIGWDGVFRIGLAEDSDKWGALVDVVMNLGVPQNAANLSSGYKTSGPMGIAYLHSLVLSVN